MGYHYDAASIPDELRRSIDVYDRINELGIDLGTFEENVTSLSGQGIANVVFHESGLVYLSGYTAGTEPMTDNPETIEHGRQGAQDAADEMIKRLHWALNCDGKGDLNDLLYTVKALGMVVSPAGNASNVGPPVTNGFSFRWQSVFGGGMSDYADNGIDPGGFAGVHTRSAIGGFGGSFSVEPEIIVAIPATLSTEIIVNRGWVFPLPPIMFDKIKDNRNN